MIEFNDKDKKLVEIINKLHILRLKQSNYFEQTLKIVTGVDDYETDGTFGSKSNDEFSNIIIDIIFQLENDDVNNMFKNLSENTKMTYLDSWFGYIPSLKYNEKLDFRLFINTMYDEYIDGKLK